MLQPAGLVLGLVHQGSGYCLLPSSPLNLSWGILHHGPCFPPRLGESGSGCSVTSELWQGVGSPRAFSLELEPSTRPLLAPAMESSLQLRAGLSTPAARLSLPWCCMQLLLVAQGWREFVLRNLASSVLLKPRPFTALLQAAASSVQQLLPRALGLNTPGPLPGRDV